jgi:hypothetical protein
MDILPPLIPDRETPELPQPGQGPLHHPAVATQLLTGLDALVRNADHDVPPGQGPTAAGDVIGFVSVQLDGSSPSLSARAPDRRDAVYHLLEHSAVVAVGPSQVTRQWRAASVGDQVALGAR